MKSKYKIVVIVDDDPDAIDLWRREIEASKFIGTASFCATIDEAITALQSTKPDLIVSDLKVDGNFDTYHIKKFRQIHPETSLVCYSALFDMQIIEKIYRAGANSFVHRDNDINKDIKMMKAILKYWLHFNISPY